MKCALIAIGLMTGLIASASGLNITEIYSEPGWVSDYEGNVSSITLFLGISASPDGERLLLSEMILPAEINYAIYSMDADGIGNPHFLTYGKDPDWSPDGSLIAYSGFDTDPITGELTGSNLEIYTMDEDDNTIALTNSPQEKIEPLWSPDGSQIAYMTYRFGLPIINVMNADGTNTSVLLDDPEIQSTPRWSPDGSKIAFSSNRTGDPEIYIKDLQTGVEMQLTDNLVNDWLGGWSPDGSKILYKSGDFIFVMNPDGTGKEVLAEQEASDAIYGPDGRTVYFTSSWADEDLSNKVFRMDL